MSVALTKPELPTFAPQKKRSIQSLLERIGLRHKKRTFVSALAELQDAEEPPSEAEVIDKYLTITATSFAVALTGSIIFPPLQYLCLPGLVYTAVPIWKEAYQSLFKERRFRMVCVDAVAMPAGILAGYFVPVTMGFSFYFFAKKMLMKTQDHSKEQLVDLLGEQPRTVWVRAGDGIEVQIAFDQLQVGDTLIIESGQMIPVDGVVVQGTAMIDQRMLTGESQPVEKLSGDDVLASTMVLQGRVDVRVNTTGDETIAAQIGRIMQKTTDFKSSVQLRGEELGDRVSLPLISLSVLAWATVSPVAAVAILQAPIVYTLRLASPLSVLGYLQRGLHNGILIKDGRALELLQAVDTVVFDKTGTLTEEQPNIGAIHALGTFDEVAVLQFAATAEQKQTHPIGKAILAEAQRRELPLSPITESRYDIGFGLTILSEQKLVQVGSQRFMEQVDIALPDAIHTVQTTCNQYGHTLVYVAVDGVLAGAIELLPTARPEVPAIIEQLRERGLTTYIISGDREEPTQRLAETLHIDHYFAETLPEDKARLITQLQDEGRKVCFIGDGINDSIALKKANVPISISGATNIATDTAQIIFMDGTLNQLIPLFDLAHGLDRNMQRNVLASAIPATLVVGGAFFLNLGLYAAIGLCQLSLLIGVTNAASPSIKDKVTTNQLIKKLLLDSTETGLL